MDCKVGNRCGACSDCYNGYNGHEGTQAANKLVRVTSTNTPCEAMDWPSWPYVESGL